MRKLALILVAVLLLGTLAGCKEEKAPNFHIDNYSVHLVIPEGWTQVEQPGYDLRLDNGDAHVAFRIYNMLLDFDEGLGEPIPTLDEIYDQNIAGLRITEPGQPKKENWREVEKAKTFKSGETEISTTLYAAEVSGKTRQYLCCKVDFHNDAEIVGFVVFMGDEAFMKQNRNTFETILKDMTCDASRVTPEDLAVAESIAMDELEKQGK